jgi:hypothetical protein
MIYVWYLTTSVKKDDSILIFTTAKLYINISASYLTFWGLNFCNLRFVLHKGFSQAYNMEQPPPNIFFVVLEFELRAYTLSHSTSPFSWWIFFKIQSIKLFCLGWVQTAILLISASWVARITVVSHWHPAPPTFFDHASISEVYISHSK